MKKTSLALSLLLLAASIAGARGRGFSGPGGGRAAAGRGLARRGAAGVNFSRPPARPACARSRARSWAAPASHLVFPRGRASFGTAVKRSAGASAPASAPAWATPGALIRTAGQPPAYSTPGGGGTHSVDGGGFVAIDQKKAGDVGRGPGIAWAPPDKQTGGGSGAGGGSAITANPGF